MHRQEGTELRMMTSASYWPRAGPRMPAVIYQASLNEADVISQGLFFKGGCRCQKLAANTHGSWSSPVRGDLSGWGTHSICYLSFSHLEESAFHTGGLIQGWMSSHGELWPTWEASPLLDYMCCFISFAKPYT